MTDTDNWQYLKRLVLDFLFPPKEKTLFVRNLTEKDLYNLPQANVSADNISALFAYSDDTTRKIVQATKYDGCREGARIMGRLLYSHLLTICAENRIISKHVFLVPVPLSRQRRQKRGFNQCKRVSRHICRQDSSDTFRVLSALEKPAPTQPQTTLAKPQRRKNIAGSFAVNENVSIAGKHIIVIDDVATTGATFAEARKTLLKADPERVHAVAFAH
ncbi:MAG: hypothetical protein BRC25_02805 [Parcubacteria group bacterium SW_6_46_9]|nr:MAG: hypothetical protein BRC25_02805 [Parcubacteria group bacterium SW_6_46_9]